MAKNIVISTTGDRSMHHHWSHGTGYDTFLVYYGDGPGYEGESTFYKKAKGYKYPLLHALLSENDWLYDYEYVWLPDDDVCATPADVTRLFGLMAEHRLWLAQPSLFGWYSVDAVLHRHGLTLRYTNWVEIMCPCFSSEALMACSVSFCENKTGWGLEGVWNVLLGHPRDKMAIIDDVAVFHTRQVLTGDTYKDKTDPLGFGSGEARETYKRWNLWDEYEKDFAHGTRATSQMPYLVQYGEVKKKPPGSPDMSERIYPFGGLANLIARAFQEKTL